MELPTGETIMHAGKPYDPRKAHEYYLRTRKLKGRKQGRGDGGVADAIGKALDSVATNGQAPKPKAGVRARQKAQLSARIRDLEGKLHKLEALIKKKEAAAEQSARKTKARKNRAAKEAAKPDTAAEKAKKAKAAKQFRSKHKQSLAAKAKAAAKKSGGSSKSTPATEAKPGEMSVKELKKVATRVRGQLTVAKAKLRAL